MGTSLGWISTALPSRSPARRSELGGHQKGLGRISHQSSQRSGKRDHGGF